MVENLNTNKYVAPELLQDSASGHVPPTEPHTTTGGFDGNKASIGMDGVHNVSLHKGFVAAK